MGAQQVPEIQAETLVQCLQIFAGNSQKLPQHVRTLEVWFSALMRLYHEEPYESRGSGTDMREVRGCNSPLPTRLFMTVLIVYILHSMLALFR
jgi:hypothetical protein